MRSNQFSRTSLATATMRAVHQILDGDTLILEDPVALQLLGPDAEQAIRDSTSRYQGAVSAALRSHVVLRARYTEDRLQAAVARGLRQYILIGAGLDTFALRQLHWAKEISIIEVDHPATQAEKRTRMDAVELLPPANLKLVAVDFEHEAWCDALRRHDVDTTQPSFFAWLGVTMYLTESAIDATLNALAAFPGGSEVVLTFSQPPENRTLVASGLGAALRKHVADLGEPFISYFEPAVMEAKLRHAGFTRVEFLSAEEAKTTYFHGTTLPPPQRTGIVAAIR